MKHIFFNIILFKIGWASVVFGAAYQLAWAGSLVVAAIAVIHLATAVLPVRELILITIAASLGFVWESLLVSQHILIYADHAASSIIAPYWIVVMWVLFATTLNVSMRWLKRNLYMAISFGAFGSVLSFLAGKHIGAVSFPDTTVALLIISLGWAIIVPVIVKIADRFDGHYPAHLPERTFLS